MHIDNHSKNVLVSKCVQISMRIFGLFVCLSPCRLVDSYKTNIFDPTGNCYKRGGQTSVDCINAVETLADSLNRHKQKFDDIRLIPKIRVPILKVVHHNTGIHVDISTRNGIGIENSRLIR